MSASTYHDAEYLKRTTAPIVNQPATTAEAAAVATAKANIAAAYALAAANGKRPTVTLGVNQPTPAV